MIWFKLFTQPFHQDIDYSIIIELSANVMTFDNPFDNYKRFWTWVLNTITNSVGLIHTFRLYSISKYCVPKIIWWRNCLIENVTLSLLFPLQYHWCGVCLAFTIWQSSLCIIKYLEKPQGTKLSLQTTAQLPFPAITVCNFDPDYQYNSTILEKQCGIRYLSNRIRTLSWKKI